jgi:hypothetical protein
MKLQELIQKNIIQINTMEKFQTPQITWREENNDGTIVGRCDDIFDFINTYKFQINVEKKRLTYTTYDGEDWTYSPTYLSSDICSIEHGKNMAQQYIDSTYKETVLDTSNLKQYEIVNHFVTELIKDSIRLTNKFLETAFNENRFDEDEELFLIGSLSHFTISNDKVKIVLYKEYIESGFNYIRIPIETISNQDKIGIIAVILDTYLKDMADICDFKPAPITDEDIITFLLETHKHIKLQRSYTSC